MPLFILIVVVLIAIIGIVIYKSRTNRETISNTKRKLVNWILFVISFVSLMISFVLFYNMAIYADNYGSSPILISGGWFWLYMDWLRLGLLFVLCLITGFNAFRRS